MRIVEIEGVAVEGRGRVGPREDRIEQVGQPIELFQNPANTFVAGFIGSPAMNFFSAKLVQVDGDLVIDSGSFQVKIPQQYHDAYGTYKDKEVTFGIRPEDITDSLPVNSRGQWEKLGAKVRLVEPLGAEIILELESGKQRFTARVDPQSKSRSNEEVEVSFDMRKMHLFDAESEKVIPRK